MKIDQEFDIHLFYFLIEEVIDFPFSNDLVYDLIPLDLRIKELFIDAIPHILLTLNSIYFATMMTN